MFTRYLIKCRSLPYNLPSGSSAQTLRRARQREFQKTIFPEMVTKVLNQILLNLNKKDPAVLPKNIVYGLAGRLVKKK